MRNGVRVCWSSRDYTNGRADVFHQSLMTSDRLLPIGRLFFAAAFIGFGAEHFLFQDFVTGRAPAWPGALPGRVAGAWLSGIVMLGVSAAVLGRRYARQAALLGAGLILGWALLRHLPVMAADVLFASSWTRGGKALVLIGGALVLAGTSPVVSAARITPLLTVVNLRDEFIAFGRYALGAFLLLTGTQHFLHTPFVASLIPGWFPGDPIFWTYFGGVALLGGGLGLLSRRTAWLAAVMSGMMVFSWFWIIHLPRTLDGVSDSIAVFEALAVSGIAFMVAGADGSAKGSARQAS